MEAPRNGNNYSSAWGGSALPTVWEVFPAFTHLWSQALEFRMINMVKHYKFKWLLNYEFKLFLYIEMKILSKVRNFYYTESH